MKMVTRDTGSAAAMQTISTVGDFSSKGKAKGITRAVYLPETTTLVAGKGEVLVYLVKESEKNNAEAKPISNAITKTLVIDP